LEGDFSSFLLYFTKEISGIIYQREGERLGNRGMHAIEGQSLSNGVALPSL